MTGTCPTCKREHQERNQPTPCVGCHRPTFEVHRVCGSCQEAGMSWSFRERR